MLSSHSTPRGPSRSTPRGRWLFALLSVFLALTMARTWAEVPPGTLKSNDLLFNRSSTHTIGLYDGVTGAFKGNFVENAPSEPPPPIPYNGRLSDSTWGMTIGPNGDLYVANTGDRNILRYEGTSGAYLGVFATVDAAPNTLSFGPDGDLYVACEGSGPENCVARFDGQTGAYVSTPVPDSTPNLARPQGLLWGPDGKLYVSNYGSEDGDSVLRYDPADGSTITFVEPGAGGVSISSGWEMAFGSDGNLYLAAWNSSSVLRFDGDTSAPLDRHFAVQV